MSARRRVLRPLLAAAMLAFAAACAQVLELDEWGNTGSSGTDAATSSGSGAGECSRSIDCPGAETDCTTRTCERGACGLAHMPKGHATPTQLMGDCKVNQCDGAGNIELASAADDSPDDGKECTEPSCAGGVPAQTPATARTPCNQDGGKVCDGLGKCVECVDIDDCGGLSCAGGQCVSAMCTDGTHNGSETDVDCGGLECSPCATGDLCLLNGDCRSGVCSAGKLCAAPGCSDGVTNGTETDIDCGGTCGNKCQPNQSCAVPSDCESGVCTAGKCVGPTCSDGSQNGSETDLDCGGTCPGCTCGQSCGNPSDCGSGACGVTAKCICCNDLVQNGDETDTDCGGTCANAGSTCASGQGCEVSDDCGSGSCNGMVMCNNPQLCCPSPPCACD